MIAWTLKPRSQPLSSVKINGCFRPPFRIGTPKDDYIVCTPFVFFMFLCLHNEMSNGKGRFKVRLTPEIHIS